MLIYIGIPKCASTSITKALGNKTGVIIVRPNNGVPAHEGIVGTVYIPKERQGAPMPKKLILEYAN